jgi:hypothetical protein
MVLGDKQCLNKINATEMNQFGVMDFKSWISKGFMYFVQD